MDEEDLSAPYQQTAPVKSQEVSKNQADLQQNELQHGMARAIAHLNKQTERGEHMPVTGLMDG